MSKKLITLIIPAYNEEPNLPELFGRVLAVTGEISDFDFEFLLVDNASQDGTGTLAKAQCQRDPRWKYLRFSRNFGAEVSLAAGLRYARGDAAIFMFSDLQEPPEYLPQLIEKWQAGFDVVYGVLDQREDGSWLKRFGAYLAYKLIERLSDVRIPANATDFRLMSRRVIDALNECGETNRYLRGLVHWVGFKQTGIAYSRAPRKRGRSTTTFTFLIRFATNAIVAFSGKPLRVASIFGFVMMAFSACGALVYTLLLLLANAGLIPTEPPPPGWTTLALLVLFFGGVQSLFMGVLGEYMANIYAEVKMRPLWVIDEQLGIAQLERHNR